MQFEVEQKHPIEDPDGLIARLAERGVALQPPVVQVDQYFAHPARDFARTDEALRIRTVGGESFVTYKGPKLDGASKTRREIELPLDPQDGDGARFAGLLSALGFSPVAQVRKQRRPFLIRWENVDVHGALDNVDGLGTFVELELMADETGLEQAQRTIGNLAGELELSSSERRSYLELLLGK